MKLKVLREIDLHALGYFASYNTDELIEHVSNSTELIESAPTRFSVETGLLKSHHTPVESFEEAQKKFLQACNDTLFKYFKKSLNEGFLFSALSYMNIVDGSKPKVEIVTGDDVTGYNIHKEVLENYDQIRSLINEFLGELHDERVISLTNMLLAKTNLYDLFFIQSKSEYGAEIMNKGALIHIYHLDDFRFYDDINEFLNANEDKIKGFISKFHKFKKNPTTIKHRIVLKYARYIWNYKRLANAYSQNNDNKDFLIHFIKSSAFKSEYNILLSIATNRFLTEEELVFFDLMIYRIVSETSIGKLGEVTKHATRAAVSQVLARNMSHNIGSHVSYKATNSAIKKRIVDLYPGILEPKTLFKDEAVNDWIDFMSEKLDKYDIHRNEYLADYSLSPQSFRFYKDVVLPLCENTLILDNIASMEGANYRTPNGNKYDSRFDKNRLKIRVFIKKAGEESFREIRAKYPDLMSVFNGDGSEEEIIYPDHFPYLLKNKDEKHNLSDGINSKKIEEPGLDVEILMHSEQGLYSILENFIRNSAKHNKDKIKEIDYLEIRLHLEEDEVEEDRYGLTISDNVSKLTGQKLYNKSRHDPGLFQRMKSKIVGDGEQSGKQNLGFADMNINSFLFRYNPSDIRNDTLTKNLHLYTLSADDLLTLEKERIEDKRIDYATNWDYNETYKFGYYLRLLKPKKVLWIGEDILINQGTEKISTLKKNGIFWFKSVEKYLGDIGSNSEIAAFDFVIFYKNFDVDYYLDNQIHLPARVLVVSDSEENFDKPNIKYLEDFDDIKDADELLEKCWAKWLERIEKEKTAYIYYEENEEAEAKLEDLQLEGNNSIESVQKHSSEKTSIDTERVAIIYDHHGNAFKETNLESPNSSTENFYTNHSKMFFDKGSDDYVTLNYLPDDDHKKRVLAYRLIDAATTNIFILDERIATVANRGNDNVQDKVIGIRFSNYDKLNFSRFCYGKVFVLNNIAAADGSDKPIHFEEQNYYLSLQINEQEIKIKTVKDSETDEERSKKISRILSEINDLKKDILVIHRTYLKKDSLGLEVKEFLDLAGKVFGSVIVTSGGGYPHNLQEQVRFVPFSMIEQCIGSRLSKLKLVTYLQKLRFV